MDVSAQPSSSLSSIKKEKILFLTVGLVIGLLLSLVFLPLLKSKKPSEKAVTTTLPSQESLTRNQPSKEDVVSDNRVRAYPSYNNSYFAVLQLLEQNKCIISIHELSGVLQGFNEKLQIGCSEGMGAFDPSTFMGWIGDSKFALEPELGNLLILNLSIGGPEREKNYTHDSNLWQLVSVSQNAEYVLYKSKQKNGNASYAIYKLGDLQPVKELEISGDRYVRAYYDYTNNGFLLYWFEEKFENSKQMARNVFKYVYLSDLTFKDVLITPYIEIAGRGCYPESIKANKGELLFLSGGCFSFPEDMYDQEGRVHIKV